MIQGAKVFATNPDSLGFIPGTCVAGKSKLTGCLLTPSTHAMVLAHLQAPSRIVSKEQVLETRAAVV